MKFVLLVDYAIKHETDKYKHLTGGSRGVGKKAAHVAIFYF